MGGSETIDQPVRASVTSNTSKINDETNKYREIVQKQLQSIALNRSAFSIIHSLSYAVQRVASKSYTLDSSAIVIALQQIHGEISEKRPEDYNNKDIVMEGLTKEDSTTNTDFRIKFKIVKEENISQIPLKSIFEYVAEVQNRYLNTKPNSHFCAPPGREFMFVEKMNNNKFDCKNSWGFFEPNQSVSKNSVDAVWRIDISIANLSAPGERQPSKHRVKVKYLSGISKKIEIDSNMNLATIKNQIVGETGATRTFKLFNNETKQVVTEGGDDDVPPGSELFVIPANNKLLEHLMMVVQPIYSNDDDGCYYYIFGPDTVFNRSHNPESVIAYRVLSKLMDISDCPKGMLQSVLKKLFDVLDLIWQGDKGDYNAGTCKLDYREAIEKTFIWLCDKQKDLMKNSCIDFLKYLLEPPTLSQFVLENTQMKNKFTNVVVGMVDEIVEVVKEMTNVVFNVDTGMATELEVVDGIEAKQKDTQKIIAERYFLFLLFNNELTCEMERKILDMIGVFEEEGSDKDLCNSTNIVKIIKNMDKSVTMDLKVFEKYICYIHTNYKNEYRQPTYMRALLLTMFDDDDHLCAFLDENSHTWGKKSWGPKYFLLICFHLTNTFPNSWLKIRDVVVAKCEGKKEDLIDLIHNDVIFDDLDQIDILDALINRIPKQFFLSASFSWLKSYKISSLQMIFALFFTALDIGSDIQLTVEYTNWNKTLDQFAFPNQTYHSASCYNAACRIRNLHPKLAFYYSLIFLLITFLFQIIYLGIKICMKETETKHKDGKISRNYHLMYVFLGQSGLCRAFMWPFVALLLPFVTRVYTLVAEIQSFQLDKYREITAGNDQSNDESRRCICKTITDPELHICFVCWKGNQKRNELDYVSLITWQKSAVHSLHSNVSLILAACEDTYLPLLQLYILIPLLYHNVHRGFSFTLDYNNVSVNTIFIYSCYSVCTSIINMGIVATSCHFSKPQNKAIGAKITARLLVSVYNILVIASRLLTLVIFGLVVLPPRFAPMWLSVICLSYCMFQFLIKCVVFFAKKDKTDCVVRNLCNFFLSSLASMFTYNQASILPETSFDKESDEGQERNKKEFDSFKFLDYTIYTIVAVFAQIIGTVFIVQERNKTDIDIIIALTILWIFWFAGQTLNGAFHIFYKPWTQLVVGYKYKKMVVVASICALVLAGAFAVMYYVRISIVPLATILAVLLLLVIIIKCCRMNAEGKLLTCCTTASRNLKRKSNEGTEMTSTSNSLLIEQ